ncbi:NUDIX domain-containing protein [Nonomuraea sp. NPDC050405]|uniref:NUDIX hydrolase n=1 Tax=Nonomuraea sp. NPDC050405 TaxID=3154509 RepID=UPI0033F62B97
MNVEVFLERDGHWLLIQRGMQEANAPGVLAGVGGKVEIDGAGADVLEETARREVAEEIGVDVTGVVLIYVGSEFFVTDDGDPVINVVFRGELPAHAQPMAASAQEVAGFVWLTVAEAEANANCPPWVLRSLRRVAS